MAKKLKNKYKYKLKSNKKHVTNKRSHTINEIPHVKIIKQNSPVSINVLKKCHYFRNRICIYFNDSCNPYSIKCKNPNILISKDKYSSEKIRKPPQKDNKVETKLYKESQYVKAIVLSHNRKCVYKEHNLTNIKAIIRVLTRSNKVIDVTVLSTYCKECNQYIILKSDFKSIKLKGILLCRVIDETPEYIAKHKNSLYTGTESKVHRLGYNVIKQGYNYTFEQRKIILANIIENYGITQHEILSMLDTNIARKSSLQNYADAVAKWKEDRTFVSNYKTGDIPEVIVDKIIIGKRV